MKIQKTIWLQTRNIALGEAVGCLLMLAVFLLLGRCSWQVLLGALWGGAIAVANFFLLGLTVQAAAKKEGAAARHLVQKSYTLRSLLLLAGAVCGLLLPCFQPVAAIVPLFFPQLTIFLMRALGLYRT